MFDEKSLRIYFYSRAENFTTSYKIDELVQYKISNFILRKDGAMSHLEIKCKPYTITIYDEEVIEEEKLFSWCDDLLPIFYNFFSNHVNIIDELCGMSPTFCDLHFGIFDRNMSLSWECDLAEPYRNWYYLKLPGLRNVLYFGQFQKELKENHIYTCSDYEEDETIIFFKELSEKTLLQTFAQYLQLREVEYECIRLMEQAKKDYLKRRNPLPLEVIPM